MILLGNFITLHGDTIFSDVVESIHQQSSGYLAQILIHSKK